VGTRLINILAGERDPNKLAELTDCRIRSTSRYMAQFPLSGELLRITGVDLTQIDGINVMTAQTLISEIGLDMSRWKTEVHLVSWLGLCPNNRISGDKVLSRGTRRVVNRAATALRIAATTLFVLIKEMRRYNLVSSFDEQRMPELNLEAMDFRPASEFFRPIRRLALI
jgi:hypothetical protein